MVRSIPIERQSKHTMKLMGSSQYQFTKCQGWAKDGILRQTAWPPLLPTLFNNGLPFTVYDVEHLCNNWMKRSNWTKLINWWTDNRKDFSWHQYSSWWVDQRQLGGYWRAHFIFGQNSKCALYWSLFDRHWLTILFKLVLSSPNFND